MPQRTVGILLLSLALGWGGVAGWNTMEGEARTSRQTGSAQTRHVQRVGMWVRVTAYTPMWKKARGHPRQTASGRWVRPGIVALSRDVERALGVKFGDQVVLEGLGTFIFDDRVSRRHKRHADIFMESSRAARQFGVKKAYVWVPSEPEAG